MYRRVHRRREGVQESIQKEGGCTEGGRVYRSVQEGGCTEVECTEGGRVYRRESVQKEGGCTGVYRRKGVQEGVQVY